MGAAKSAVPFLPALSAFLPIPVNPFVATAIGIASKYAGNFQESRAASRQYKLEYQTSLQQKELNDKIRAAESRNAESARLQALRRSVARQRAMFSAQGVGSSGGSSEAVLLGLFDESEEDKRKREEMDGLKSRLEQVRIDGNNKQNLLQLTSLIEKQRLQTFFS